MEGVARYMKVFWDGISSRWMKPVLGILQVGILVGCLNTFCCDVSGLSLDWLVERSLRDLSGVSLNWMGNDTLGRARRFRPAIVWIL